MEWAKIRSKFDSDAEQLTGAMISALTGIPLVHVLVQDQFGDFLTDIHVPRVFEDAKSGYYDMIPILSMGTLIDHYIDTLHILEGKIRNDLKEDSTVEQDIVGIETESDGIQHTKTGEGFLLRLGFTGTTPVLAQLKEETGVDITAKLRSPTFQDTTSLEKYMDTFSNQFSEDDLKKKEIRDKIDRIKDEYNKWLEYLDNDEYKQELIENYGADNSKKTSTWQDIDLFQIRVKNDIRYHPYGDQFEQLCDGIIEKVLFAKLNGELENPCDSFEEFKEKYINTNARAYRVFRSFSEENWMAIR